MRRATILGAAGSLKVPLFLVGMLWTAPFPALHAQEKAAAATEAAPVDKEKHEERNSQQALVFEAAELAKRGRTDDALSKVDQALAGYRSRFTAEKRRIYSARSAGEVLLYMATAANDRQSAVAVEPEYGYAWYLRGYLLVEQQRADDALVALGKAIELAPMNSQFLSEAAHVHQDRRGWDDALKLYERAEGASEFSEDLAPGHRARARRGKGYVLARLGRLDEAEKAYRAALEIDPSDSRAKDGINAIRELQEGFDDSR